MTGHEEGVEEMQSVPDLSIPDVAAAVSIEGRFDPQGSETPVCRVMRSRTRMCPLKVNLKELESRLRRIFSHMDGSTHTSSEKSSISITIFRPAFVTIGSNSAHNSRVSLG